MRNRELRFFCRLPAVALLVLFGGLLAATPSQAQASDPLAQPITLDLRNVPLPVALKTLFLSAGIRNYVIGSDIHGSVSLTVADVPGSLALRRMLSSAQPPLELTTAQGTYKISAKRAPLQNSPRPSDRTQVEVRTAGTAKSAKQFYAVPINRYDAYFLAGLLGSQGIVEVGANDVNPNGKQQSGTGSGRTGGPNAGGSLGNRGSGFGGGVSSPFGTAGSANGGFGR